MERWNRGGTRFLKVKIWCRGGKGPGPTGGNATLIGGRIKRTQKRGFGTRPKIGPIRYRKRKAVPLRPVKIAAAGGGGKKGVG